MKRDLVVMLSTIVLLLSSVARAEEEPPSSHDQAVLELFQLAGLERIMTSASTAMIDAQIQSNPAIAPYRDVMMEWVTKYSGWHAMAPELTKIYKEAFTESELREVIAFYKTPTGQKALAKLPELMQKGSSLGASLAQKHLVELETMVQERKKQLEAGEQKP